MQAWKQRIRMFSLLISLKKIPRLKYNHWPLRSWKWSLTRLRGLSKIPGLRRHRRIMRNWRKMSGGKWIRRLATSWWGNSCGQTWMELSMQLDKLRMDNRSHLRRLSFKRRTLILSSINGQKIAQSTFNEKISAHLKWSSSRATGTQLSVNAKAQFSSFTATVTTRVDMHILANNLLRVATTSLE